MSVAAMSGRTNRPTTGSSRLGLSTTKAFWARHEWLAQPENHR